MNPTALLRFVARVDDTGQTRSILQQFFLDPNGADVEDYMFIPTTGTWVDVPLVIPPQP